MSKIGFRNITIDQLTEFVKSSKTQTEVLEKMGLVAKGGSFRILRDRLQKWNVDTSHFVGSAWAKGLTMETDERIRINAEKNKIINRDSLRFGVKINTLTLRRLMIEEGKPYKCEECDIIPMWNGKPLTIQIDHINGVNIDNRIENLRFLCPNCHTQTETHGNKSQRDKKYRIIYEDIGKISEKNCLVCEKMFLPKNRNQTLCSYQCSRVKSRKVVARPSKEVLEKEIREFSFIFLAKKYGISDNGVRKWAKNYGIDIKAIKKRE